jgi:thymidylate synthase (FAD)
MYKAIAKAGHICYASEKEGDEEAFVKRCISLGHMRPLEFGTVYLKVPYDSDLIDFYNQNSYSATNWNNDYCYITTNYRVLVENDCIADLHYWCEPTEFHVLRHCILWEHIGRDIADEFRTHIGLSSLMQSTRYCAYDKDKFGGEIICIKPQWLSQCDYHGMKVDEREFFKSLEDAERHYMVLRTNYKWSAEQARKVLPLDVATVFIQCGFEKDWDNFFNQRVLGTTGTPHPDAKEIAEMIYEEYKASKQSN